MGRINNFWRDVRQAGRSSRAAPTLTFVTVLSIALGIGASTALFSIVNSLLLRPLPVSDPQRLVKLATTNSGDAGAVYSYAVFDNLRQHRAAFDGALAYACCRRGTLTSADRHEPVDQLLASDDFFATLGLQPHRGRLLSPGDDSLSGGAAGPNVVISYGLWQRLGGEPDVVGRLVTIDGVPMTVIGITQPSFFGLEVGRTFDVAIPIHAQALLDPAAPLGDHLEILNVWLRLRRDTTVSAATMALRASQPEIRARAMPSPPRSQDWLTDPFTLRPVGWGTSALRDQFARPAVALFGLVVLLFLITCANVANLLLARGIARRQEVGVRVSLGATRSQLIRLFAVESLVLAVAGAIGGLIFGRWASEVLAVQLSTAARAVSLDLSVDWRVIAFVTAAVLVTVMTSGVAPALRATRVDPIEALQDHGRIVSGHTGALFRWVLVAQVAISLVLVVAAGLFVRTFERLSNVALGFDREVIVATIAPTTVPANERNRLYHQLVRSIGDLPSVAHAGGSLNPPLIGRMGGGFVVSRPGAAPPPDAERISQFMDITPGWFDAYGTTFHAGRDFSEYDTSSSERVMIVNQAFVQRILRREDAVGVTVAVTSRFASLGDIPLGPKTIVGVVADTAYRSVRETERPTIYFPLAQREGPILFDSFFITIKSKAGSPMLMTRALSAAVAGVNPNLSVTYRGVDDQVRDVLAQDRVVAMLASFFGALALLLAGLGLYGVTSYHVTRRRREIALRLALGTTPRSVVRLLVLRLAVIVGIGLAIGTVVSLSVSALVSSLVFGVGARDAMTFAASILVLVVVCACAGCIPALRAARVAPAAVLRES